jgi:hypothetical protein
MAAPRATRKRNSRTRRKRIDLLLTEKERRKNEIEKE